MKRVALLNYLIETQGYDSYLEIGCGSDRTFRRIAASHRVGVDPQRGGTLRMTSDDFFAVNCEQFDLIFVDGLHLAEQVLRDVDHALQCLTPAGCVVLHDCLPIREHHQLRAPSRRSWTGDVWKAAVQLRQRRDCDFAVLDSDWGLGVLFPRPNTDLLPPQPALSWNDFCRYRDNLLRVIDEDALEDFVNGRPVATSLQRGATSMHSRGDLRDG